MAFIYAEMGDLATAEQLLARTVELDEDIGHPDLESDRAELEQVRQLLQNQPQSEQELEPGDGDDHALSLD